MTKTLAYAAQSATTPLAPFDFKRRDPGPRDVQMDILFCGVCHTDLHFVRNEWGFTLYPCVPGHEIVGRVTRVGSDVKGFKEGALAAVGCLVDSCRECGSCREGLENYCEKGSTFTYNGPDKHTGGHTFGGYSTAITVDEAFTLRVPESPRKAARDAPIAAIQARKAPRTALCAHHEALQAPVTPLKAPMPACRVAAPAVRPGAASAATRSPHAP